MPVKLVTPGLQAWLHTCNTDVANDWLVVPAIGGESCLFSYGPRKETKSLLVLAPYKMMFGNSTEKVEAILMKAKLVTSGQNVLQDGI